MPKFLKLPINVVNDFELMEFIVMNLLSGISKAYFVLTINSNDE